MGAKLDPEMQKFFEGVVGVVEATSYEKMCLWRESHQEMGKPWEQGYKGYNLTIGKVLDMPVTVGLYVDKVDGHRIVFLDTPSQVVDHRMVEEWLKVNLPKTAFADRGSGRYLNMVNAMNFYNVFPRAGRLALKESKNA